MLGSLNYELLLIMIPISLLVLLRLWRILSKLLASNGGLDFGTTVDQLLASNIDSLLNRYSLISENHGAALSQGLDLSLREVWWRLDKIDEELSGLNNSKKDINAQKSADGAKPNRHDSDDTGDE